MEPSVRDPNLRARARLLTNELDVEGLERGDALEKADLTLDVFKTSPRVAEFDFSIRRMSSSSKRLATAVLLTCLSIGK
jgi:hypothetical protein